MDQKISELYDKFYKDRYKKENFIKIYRYNYDEIYLLNFKRKFVKKSIENLKKKYELIILTNKPCKPSRKIINHIGLSKTFFKIIGIDFYDKEKATKKNNLKNFLKNNKYKNKIYVGDTLEDKDIADIFECKFLCVKSKYEWQKVDKESISMFNKVNKEMNLILIKYSDKISNWIKDLGYTDCFFVAGGNIMHLLNSFNKNMKMTPFVHEAAAR